MNMKRVAAAVLGFAVSTTIAAADASVLKTDADKLSYSIGADLGGNFKKQSIPVNAPMLAKGMQDAMAGGQMLLNEDQMKEVLMNFQKQLIEKRTAEFNKKADESKAKGEAFLTQNKAKAGVVTLPSGLQYKVVTKAEGAKPSANDSVTVDYTGKLINGDVFDSSEKTGKPATFKVSQVIPGWTEALQLMPVGSTWEIYVPANLAYGPRSVGGQIGPNETLVFTIHLISVNKDKASV